MTLAVISRCTLYRTVSICLSVNFASTLADHSNSVVGELVVIEVPKGVSVSGKACAARSRLENQNRRSFTNGPPAVKPSSCLKKGAREVGKPASALLSQEPLPDVSVGSHAVWL